MGGKRGSVEVQQLHTQCIQKYRMDCIDGTAERQQEWESILFGIRDIGIGVSAFVRSYPQDRRRDKWSVRASNPKLRTIELKPMEPKLRDPTHKKTDKINGRVRYKTQRQNCWVGPITSERTSTRQKVTGRHLGLGPTCTPDRILVFLIGIYPLLGDK